MSPRCPTCGATVPEVRCRYCNTLSPDYEETWIDVTTFGSEPHVLPGPVRRKARP